MKYLEKPTKSSWVAFNNIRPCGVVVFKISEITLSFEVSDNSISDTKTCSSFEYLQSIPKSAATTDTNVPNFALFKFCS